MAESKSKAKKLTTRQRKEIFLEKYEYYGAVWPACKAAGIRRRATPYDWKKKDPAFAAAFDEVQDRVEDELASSVILTGKGRKIMNADQLRAAMFTLKALNPQKYAEKHQVGGIGGGPVEVEHDVKGKLLGLLNRLAPGEGEAEGDTGP